MSKPVVTMTPEEFARGAQQILGRKPAEQPERLSNTIAVDVAKNEKNEWWHLHRGWTRMISRRGKSYKGLRDLSITVYQDHLEIGSSEVRIPIDAAKKLLSMWQANRGEFSYTVNGTLTVRAHWQSDSTGRNFHLYVTDNLSKNLHDCLASEWEARRALGEILMAMPVTPKSP